MCIYALSKQRESHIRMALLVSVLALLFSVTTAYKTPHYVNGHDTMVHLFEWKWKDIADECERFLGPMGYGGIQVL